MTAVPDLGPKLACATCGVTWQGDPNCWNCNRPGEHTRTHPHGWATQTDNSAIEPQPRQQP